MHIGNVLKLVDPYGRYVSSVLCFEDCMCYKSMIVKPLKRVAGLVEGKYILIDDNIANVLINKGNSILISPYRGNSHDTELLKILNFLVSQCYCVDITKSIDSLY